jgi:hypothetical protein
MFCAPASRGARMETSMPVVTESEILEAIDAAADAEAKAVRLRLRAELLISRRSGRADLAAAPTEASRTVGLCKRELAGELGVSRSTVDRFDREGAPHTFVGDHRRYDLAAYRAWLGARGKRGTKASKRAMPSVDVDDVIAASGLRSVGGT